MTGSSHLIAFLDHHLLRQEDLLGGDLHAQVSSGNHDGITLLHDLIKVLDAFLVLDLGDDLYLSSLGAQHLYTAGSEGGKGGGGVECNSGKTPGSTRCRDNRPASEQLHENS